MMLIPLIAIGLGLALWASSRHQVAHQTAQAHLLAPSPILASGAPSPLVVLGELLRAGQLPPPFVVACAIAEAEAMGRLDVSSMLVEAFVRPVVEAAQAAQASQAAHQIAQARNANPPLMSSPMSSLMAPSMDPSVDPSVDPSMDPWGAVQQAPMPASAYRSPMPPMGSMGGRQKRHPHHAHHHAHQARAHQAYQGDHGDPFWPASGVPGAPSVPMTPGVPGMFDGANPMPGASSPMNIVDPAYGTRVEIVDRPDRPSPGSARAYAAAQGQEQTPREGTITVSGMNSPIADIPNEAWAEFARRVQRELPTFTTQRHVGQFRQRKDRLADLGFDPDSLVSSPDLQRAAFAADMADAYHHASESGLVQEHQGTVVEVPNATQGSVVPVRVTLSGVLGVIQAAGLEGAAAWLESPDDRRRFPGTTAAFLRTNGAF